MNRIANSFVPVVAAALFVMCGCGKRMNSVTEATGPQTNLQMNLEFMTSEAVMDTARRKPQQILHIAQDLAKTKGYALHEYLEVKIDFDPQDKKHPWTVFFDHNPPARPGEHFLVWVDDATGEAQLMTGE